VELKKEHLKEINLILPPIYRINKEINKNKILQLKVPEIQDTFFIIELNSDNGRRYIIRNKTDKYLVVYNKKNIPKENDKILLLKDKASLDNYSDLEWIKHPELSIRDIVNLEKQKEKIINSWNNRFYYKKEERINDINYPGLRPPQIGALHSILSHWTVSGEPSTIVMPTGTGKTETMLSILISNKCNKVLVVVPSDSLRTQVSKKFIKLGVLKEFNIIDPKSQYPIVGVIKHRFKTCEEAEKFMNSCNVVVTTMSIISGLNDEIKSNTINCFNYLFIDEAHHIAAKTWYDFKKRCKAKKIVQFTATPFRNDGKNVDGKIIFNYPLNKAQKEGYFKNINFLPIKEFYEEIVDARISEIAVKQLEKDLEKGYNHILMARVNGVNRAKEIFKIYKEYEKHNPVIIHNRMGAKDKNNTLKIIREKRTRIIVCVDMLGEGFDLPELKIAALHDTHKSLGVSLQFIGRFTRTKDSSIGDASIIANIADPKVGESLETLYSEDADWNLLIRQSSTKMIENRIEFANMIDGFNSNIITDIPLQNIFPKMSTVIYRTSSSEWTPEEFNISSNNKVIHTINNKKNVLIVVEENIHPISWGKIKEISNRTWDLYILYFDKCKKVLYINSSIKALHKQLANSVVQGSNIISGEQVYKSLYGINRMLFHSVGLKDAYNGPVNYRMFAGSNIEDGITDSQKRKTIKSNLFGVGYENGKRISIGCSYKGKIWAKVVTNLKDWCLWCDALGEKILDKSINVDEIFNGVLIPVIIDNRPQLYPLTIEWPLEFYTDIKANINIIYKEEKIDFDEIDILLDEPTENGNLIFKIKSDYFEKKYELVFRGSSDESQFEYKNIDEIHDELMVKKGNKKMIITDWFVEYPPVIRFVDGSFLENNYYVKTNNGSFEPYSKDKLIVWNWDNVNIKKESQGLLKRKDSIQYYTINKLKNKAYDIIIDDDNSGEAADIITINVNENANTINVELYHCKFSKEKTAGARVQELYEVCGQAQKSINWKESLGRLIDHIKRREHKRISENKPSRFEKGDINKLMQIKKMDRFYQYDLKIFIVQPGLSASKISVQQQEILAATENYLHETYKIHFKVICSK
jgi:superfamily II DNA or RNA helicase